MEDRRIPNGETFGNAADASHTDNGAAVGQTKEYRISVVIPCYNQEEYVFSCLESLAQQKFEGLEIIMVDDGSTDLTKQKIEEYKSAHPELDVFYYYQENAGPGVARNTALDNAHGKYIAFLDSDDLLPAGAYNALHYTAEKYHSDVVIGEYFRRIDNGPWYVYDYIEQYCKEHEGKNCAGDYIVAIKNPSLWNRLFNREFLNSNNIRFLPEMHGEDVVFNLDAVKHAKRIYTTRSIVYCYTKKTQAQNSVSTCWNLRNSASRLRAIKTYTTYFDKIGDVEAECIYLKSTAEYFISGLNTITDRELQQQLFEQFKETLVMYKGNIRYERFIEMILGVSLDIVLEVPYRVYKMLIGNTNETHTSAPKGVRYPVSSSDPKQQVLKDFEQGRIGFVYIWSYFKAWVKFKLKRNK